MQFLEAPSTSSSLFSQNNRSSSQTNFIIEEDSRSDISDLPSSSSTNGIGSAKDAEKGRLNLCMLLHPIWVKLSLIILCLLVIILIGVSGSIAYLYFHSIPSFETCKTRQCTKTATLFLRTMDETIDPCDDFHKFACGNWISDTAAVVSVTVYDHTTIMRDRIVGRLRSLTENITNHDIEALQQIRIMYNTCVNLATIETEGVQPLADLLLRLINPKNSIAKTLATIHRETGQDYIFDMNIGPNFKNTSVNLISIDQPQLPLSKANFLYTPQIITAYETLIEKAFTRLTLEPHFPHGYFGDVTKAARKIASFERLFALVLSPPRVCT